MLDKLELFVNRAASDAEILMWNSVIHSWVDPVFIACIFAALFYGGYRAIKYME